jgi:MSHA biogenesis protein MshM
MYEEYFGLNRPPFKITPDTSLFFGGGKRGDILGALVYAVHRGEGIVKVVGEVGSGKTMLCRMLQQELPKSVEIIYIANPSVSAEDILFVMAHELELLVPNQATKHQVMHMLQDYLVQRHVENKQVVLFIEEAQGMPLDTLEEIRLLSNLETDQNKLLQIILFGQPELDENLALKSIRQLRERITHTFNLLPLSTEEVHLYLNFRMREVGYTGPEIISKNIAKKIQRYSGGLLRRINIITDKMLLSAFAESTHNITTRHVMAAVNDSDFKLDSSHSNNKWILMTLLVIIALAIAQYQFREQWLAVVLGQPAFNSAAQIESKVSKIIPNNQNDLNVAKPQLAPQKDTAANVMVSNIDNAQPETILSNQINAVANIQVLDTEAVNEVIKSGETAPKKKDEKKDEKKQTVNVDRMIASDGTQSNKRLAEDYNQWLDAKIKSSLKWLENADKGGVSIQVMMRQKTEGKELVRFLQNDWPLDLEGTHLYEVQSTSRHIYRVFYGEFDSVSDGGKAIKKLPKTVRVNDPYLHSIYKMQAALLN